MAALTRAVGTVMGAVGADAIPASSWSSLAAVSGLSALARARRAIGDPRVDAVVIEAGTAQQTRELVELPVIVGRLLEATRTPRVAMWRAPDGEPGAAFEALSDLRSQVGELARMLEHPTTVARLMTPIEEEPLATAMEVMPVLAMLGVGVEGVLAEPDDRDAEAAASSEGTWILGPSADPVRLAEDSLAWTAEGLDFALDVPLVGRALDEAIVGRRETDLVVSFAGSERWLPLPSVLQRCRATGAVRTSAGLRVAFTPDESAWRRPPASSA